MRLDEALVQRGLVPTRSQAFTAVLDGKVCVNGQPARKAGQKVGPLDELTVTRPPMWVSRGGEKLAHALERFALPVAGLRALDVGASTGGFTDCLLQRGAREVVAVDVGYGQFHWRLRHDPRVRLLERTNARYLEPAAIGGAVELCVIDVSFISLARMWPAVRRCLVPEGRGVALVKPQFEAGRSEVGRGGVVRDQGVHRRVLADVERSAREAGIGALDLVPSPILGPKGNVEFLMLLGPLEAPLDPRIVDAVLAEARLLTVRRGPAPGEGPRHPVTP